MSDHRIRDLDLLAGDHRDDLVLGEWAAGLARRVGDVPYRVLRLPRDDSCCPDGSRHGPADFSSATDAKRRVVAYRGTAIGTVAHQSLQKPPVAGYVLYCFVQSIPKIRVVQDVQRKIGTRLRELRLERGLSQDVLADASGLNRAHIGELERGECNVTIRTLKILADTFKVKIAYIVRDV